MTKPTNQADNQADNQVLFVYGSLKRGGRHHAELRGARFLGSAVTAPGYVLEELGEYLALVPETERQPQPDAAGVVPGELFAVDEALLGLLDEFEGPDYERRPLVVTEGLGAGAAAAAAERDDGRAAAERDDGRAEFQPLRLALAYFRRTR